MKVDMGQQKRERRDYHCKIYVEQSLADLITKCAQQEGKSFSEAGRQLLIWGLERGDW